jgi:hypothetical protein
VTTTPVGSSPTKGGRGAAVGHAVEGAAREGQGSSSHSRSPHGLQFLLFRRRGNRRAGNRGEWRGVDGEGEGCGLAVDGQASSREGPATEGSGARLTAEGICGEAADLERDGGGPPARMQRKEGYRSTRPRVGFHRCSFLHTVAHHGAMELQRQRECSAIPRVKAPYWGQVRSSAWNAMRYLSSILFRNSMDLQTVELVGANSNS